MNRPGPRTAAASSFSVRRRCNPHCLSKKAARERGLKGQIWNVADDEPAPPQDVIAYAAALLSLEPPPEEPFVGARLSPMAREFYADNKRVSIAKAKSELGFAPAYPTYREGLRALAAMGQGSA